MRKVRGQKDLSLVAERKEQILQAAMELFSDRGYKGTSMQDITDRLGVARTAPYYWFRNKRDILWTLLEEVGFGLLREAQGVVAVSDSPSEELGAICRRHVEVVLEHRELYIIYFDHRTELDEGQRAKIAKDERVYTRIVQRVITEGVSAGELRDVDVRLATRTVLGTCNAPLRWYRRGGALTISEVAAFVADMAVRGLTSGTR